MTGIGAMAGNDKNAVAFMIERSIVKAAAFFAFRDLPENGTDFELRLRRLINHFFCPLCQEEEMKFLRLLRMKSGCGGRIGGKKIQRSPAFSRKTG